MRMRNLNPYAGLRQLVTGYLYLPRRPILEWIRGKKINSGQLGNLFVFLVSADWDKDPRRRGFIRFSDADLSDIWRIPISNLRRWREELTSIGFMEKVSGCYRITILDIFSSFGAKEFSGKIADEEISRLFPDVIKDHPYLRQEYSKTEESELRNIHLFDSSFKKRFEGNFKRREVTRNDQSLRSTEIARRKDKNERSTASGSLTPEDKEWINKNVTDSPQAVTTNDQLERDVKETLF